jgi:archaellum component FlaG (FlaF/FlaG flagellin family)
VAGEGGGDDESTVAGEGGGDDGSTAAGEGDGSDGGAVDVDFGADVESIEKCSTTCRTLTYAIENRGTDAASDVVVGIEVFTGGENVYDQEQDVGTVHASSRRTGITRDIDVGLLDAQNIKSNDGEIRIELTSTAGAVSETFEFEATLDV